MSYRKEITIIHDHPEVTQQKLEDYVKKVRIYKTRVNKVAF